VILGRTGDQDLAAKAVTLSGAGSAAFRIDFDSCSAAVLPAGWPCTVSVSVRPTDRTARTAMFNLATNARNVSVPMSVN
jgi:hypothetical protein